MLGSALGSVGLAAVWTDAIPAAYCFHGSPPIRLDTGMSAHTCRLEGQRAERLKSRRPPAARRLVAMPINNSGLKANVRRQSEQRAPPQTAVPPCGSGLNGNATASYLDSRALLIPPCGWRA